MDGQATQSNVLCTNGFQPLSNGDSGIAGCQRQSVLSPEQDDSRHSVWGSGTVATRVAAWQRKRNREGTHVNGHTTGAGAEVSHNGTASKRQCLDLYHSKLQQAMGISNGVNVAEMQSVVPVDNGMDGVSIGSDSMMMMTDECNGMDATGCTMLNGVESVHRNGHSSSDSAGGVMTVGALQMPPHTCCTSRAQLCTMSFQQSYVLSSTQDCARCLAGEPAPYLSIHQTVENLSKLY